MPYNAQEHRFNVVYDGRWYLLASGREHRERGIPYGQALLIDRRLDTRVVPLASCHIPAHPIPHERMRKRLR